jgi:hypothetical protein
MAALNYFAIGASIQTMLAADSTLSGIPVLLEEEFNYGLADSAKAVGIYADSRSPTPEQPAAAGKRTRMHIRYRLWCLGFSMESIADAISKRDTLIGAVEIALMGGRNFGRTDLESSWLEGGELFSAHRPNPGGFIALGEILLCVSAVIVHA